MSEKINEIEVKITKAVITSVTVEIDKDEPVYTVSGNLLTEHGMKVSTFQFSNRDWYSEQSKISIPYLVHAWSAEIFKALNPVVRDKINGMFKQLPSGGINVR